VVCVLAGAAFAAPPKGAIEPANPRWGERIRVVYSGSALLHAGQVVALLSARSPEGSQRATLPMSPAGDLLEAQWTVPDNTSYITANFVTRDASDGSANAMVRDREGQDARDAWHQSMTSPYLQEDYRKRAAKELELYPDNWQVYRDKWFVAQAIEPAELKSIIHADMETLRKEAPGRPVSALYSLQYGYLLLGDPEGAFSALREMVQRFPDSHFTRSALLDYEYQAYSQHFTGENSKQVAAWRTEYYQRNTKAARGDLDTFIGGEKLADETVEAICKSWIADDPGNPTPYTRLAALKIPDALEYAGKALNMLAAGDLRFHGDISGQQTERLIAGTAMTAARRARDRGMYAQALAYARLAETSGKQTEADAWNVEAGIWEKLGRPSHAQTAWKEAWRAGDQGAYAQLTESYRQSHGSMDGFEKFLGAGGGPKKRPAPPFQGTTLDGQPVDSAQLRGKVVVANFWFTGCGPCKAEIPDLNRLADDFAGRNVVFLAFTLDDDEATLRRFLSEHPFHYTIVPKAGKVATAFDVQSYPTHVILAPNGDIETSFVGAGEGRAEQIRTVVTRLVGQ